MKKKFMFRRILSLVLSITLVMGDIPILPTIMPVQAAPGDEIDAISADTLSDDTVSLDTVSDDSVVITRVPYTGVSRTSQEQ